MLALAGVATAEAKPNVIVIMTDDQAMNTMHAMPKTQRLIGDEGATFHQAAATFPLCCPSRATLYTGQYAHNHGVLDNALPLGGLPKLTRTQLVQKWMQKAGYATVHIGKYLNLYADGGHPKPEPFWDEWYGTWGWHTMWGFRLNENGVDTPRFGGITGGKPEEYQTDVYRDRAVSVIKRLAPQDKPFLLDLQFSAPHAEGLEDLPGYTLPNPPLIRAAPRHEGLFADTPLPRPPSFNEADISDKVAGVARKKKLTWKEIVALERGYRDRLRSLAAVDEAVEAIVAALDEAGELDETLIIFTSDNGVFTGEHRISGGKIRGYDPAVRVPLLMRGPGVAKGQNVRIPVGNHDVPATIMSVAGAVPGGGDLLDGTSLVPLAKTGTRSNRPIVIENGVAQPDGSILGPLGYGPNYQGLRTTRYHYLAYEDGQRELFDLQLDPHQLQNVAGTAPYAVIEQVLAADLQTRRACRGQACTAPVKHLPPGPIG